MASESTGGAGGSISAFFEQDHREIDAIFASVNFDSPAEALVKFKEFDRRLERHINWEEDKQHVQGNYFFSFKNKN